ncbi:MAG TPA: tRNA isopentenyl-2-thiomethyl-A-37 hydroxylase MiaE, partial [Bacteroidia bacterium]|nr:tRNA isopentenyl-2-thiomethyl-A-37 hydroxylase MiaE [Bacteroidia bacterium]
MLGLKLATDPRWVNIVESNIDEILTDHAYCEQKAASNAISLIVHYPEFSEMVSKLSEIAREELEHFRQVHELIVSRGGVLGKERKDDYVNELMEFTRVPNRTRAEVLVDRLLFAAMIEAR